MGAGILPFSILIQLMLDLELMCAAILAIGETLGPACAASGPGGGPGFTLGVALLVIGDSREGFLALMAVVPVVLACPTHVHSPLDRAIKNSPLRCLREPFG